MTKLSPPDINEVLRLRTVFGADKPLALIPLLVARKIPAQAWKSAFEDGPWSEDRLRGIWRTRGQELNPGIACGPLSGPQGLVVVDGDNDAALVWMREHLPQTPARTVTRHGEHWLYGHPAGEAVGNRSDALGSKRRFEADAGAAGFDVRLHPKPGPEEQAVEKKRAAEARAAAVAAGVTVHGVIDVRGRGGQVVAPGAIHASGFRYAMASPWTADMVLPVFDPAWFEGVKWQPPAQSLLDSGLGQAEYLARRQGEKWLAEARENTTYDEKTRRARAYLATIEGAIGGAGGHDKLFYAACRLVKGFLLDGEDALGLLLSDYNSRCAPEWSYDEIAHKVDDAVRQLGADDGFMLVDRGEWVAARKFYAVREWVAEDVDGPDPGAYEGVALVPVADESVLPNPPVPGASPTQPAPPDGDDVRQWRGLWAGKGVRYEDLGPEGWDRRKDGTGAGRWTLPPTTNNLVAVLTHNRHFAGRLAYNDLTMSPEIDGRNLRDSDERLLHGRLGLLWGEEMVRERVRDAIARVADAGTYDPWTQFVSGLPAWDGQDHLATFVSEVLGIDQSLVPETWQQAHCEWRHQLTGAMARNLVPGTKMETIMILVGGQGRMKSTLLRELFNGRQGTWNFFTDQKFRLDDKDGLMLISRFPACEWGEAEHAKNPKAIDTIKAFLAQREDVFRPPYGRAMVTRPRRVVFFGTSNESEGLLHDVTGNRRFYVCNIGRNNLDLLRLAEIRDQLWAQVLAAYARHQEAAKALRAGDMSARDVYDATRWWYTSDEDAARAPSLQPYVAENAYHEALESWLAGRSEPFRVMDVVKEVLDLSQGQVDVRKKRDVTEALVRLGCTRLAAGASVYVAGRQGRFWAPPDKSGSGDDEF